MSDQNKKKYQKKKEIEKKEGIQSKFELYMKKSLPLVFLTIFTVQSVYINFPFQQNFSLSFLIGHLIFLAMIFCSWYYISILESKQIHQIINEDYINKNIQYKLKKKQKENENICLFCQINNMAKILMCQICNHNIQKHYFHSKWLYACIHQDNFTFFVSFMVFYFIDLIFLVINHLFLIYSLNLGHQYNFTDFLSSNIQHLIIFLFIILIFIFIFITFFLLAKSYFKVLKKKKNNLINEQTIFKRHICQSLQIVLRNNQFETLKDLINNYSLQDNKIRFFQYNGKEETEQMNVIDRSSSQFELMSEQEKENRMQSICSIQKYPVNLFKTDCFSSAKIFRKKLDSLQRSRKRKSNQNKQNRSSNQQNTVKKIKPKFNERQNLFIEKDPLSIQQMQKKLKKMKKMKKMKKTKQDQKHQSSVVKNKGLSALFLSSFSNFDKMKNQKQEKNEISKRIDEPLKRIKFIKKASKGQTLTDIFRNN